MNPVFLVGAGYVGLHIARRIQSDGLSPFCDIPDAARKVMALARSDESYEVLRAQGLHVVRGDLDAAASLANLPVQGAFVYYLAPPPSTGTLDPRMRNFLKVMMSAECPARIVLISTSGVYGDCNGEWVTEDRSPRPAVDRARRRLDAEQQLRAWGEARSVPVVILRVSGIYGPGRLPEKRLRAGEPVLREQESPWSNRVHIDDLTSTCLAAGEHGRADAIYNVSDGNPTTMTDYFNRVADVLGVERPPQISLAQARVELSEGMKSYLAESKRIDNRRMREELGVGLRYPNLAQGLAASVARARSGSGQDAGASMLGKEMQG